MNTAGALAVSISEAGPETFDDRLRVNLQRTVGTLQDLFGKDQIGPLDVNELAVQLSSPFLTDLVGAVTLQDMRETGAAGLPRFTPEEFKRFLDGVPDGEGQPVSCWLEFAPVGGGDGWVAYPQDSRPAARFVVYFPVIVSPEDTRLVAVDLGLDLLTGATDRPSVVNGSGCEPGWRGHDKDLRQACLPGTCTKPCGERWQMDKGELRLVACNC